MGEFTSGLEQWWGVERCGVAASASVGARVPSAGDGVADGQGTGVAVSTFGEVSDDSGATAGDGIEQVRRLGRGDKVPRVDAHAQRFIAAVFADRALAQLARNQQREPVRVLGAADATGSPTDGWQTVGIRDVCNWRGSCLVNRVAVAG